MVFKAKMNSFSHHIILLNEWIIRDFWFWWILITYHWSKFSYELQKMLVGAFNLTSVIINVVSEFKSYILSVYLPNPRLTFRSHRPSDSVSVSIHPKNGYSIHFWALLMLTRLLRGQCDRTFGSKCVVKKYSVNCLEAMEAISSFIWMLLVKYLDLRHFVHLPVGTFPVVLIKSSFDTDKYRYLLDNSSHFHNVVTIQHVLLPGICWIWITKLMRPRSSFWRWFVLFLFLPLALPLMY